jgi:hypothetical protein
MSQRLYDVDPVGPVDIFPQRMGNVLESPALTSFLAMFSACSSASLNAAAATTRRIGPSASYISPKLQALSVSILSRPIYHVRRHYGAESNW